MIGLVFAIIKTKDNGELIMSFRTIWRYVMGVNKDISGRSEKRQSETNARFENAVKAHNEACDRMAKQSVEITQELALDRIERAQHHAGQSPV